MTETNHEEEVTPVTPMTSRDLIAVLATGAVAGLVIWAVYRVLMGYVAPLVFCQDNTTSICASAPAVMDGVALIAGGVVGLLGLIRLRTFRPLLVVLAIVLSLGGLAQQLDTMPWYWAVPFATILFAVAYAFYAWVARVRVFWLAVAIIVLLGVLIRFVLFS
jgi:hypothetical protein